MAHAPPTGDSTINRGSVEQAFAQALALHQNGRLAEAETAYRALLDRAPDHINARHHLGLIALQGGDHQTALGWLEDAAARASDDPRLLVHLGMAQHRAGRHEAAILSYRRALENRPGYVAATIGLAGVFGALNRSTEALEMARQAEAMPPETADHWTQLGGIYYGLGEGEQAVKACRAALTLAPDYVGALFNIGLAYLSLRRLDDAEQSFRRVLSIQPANGAAHDALGTCLRNQGRNDEALSAYQSAARLQPDAAEIQSNLGSMLRITGRIVEAIVCFRRAVKLNPDNPGFASNLAYALHYSPEVTPDELLQAHKDWDKRHGAPLRAYWRPHHNVSDPERPLRVGYVSADLCRHPVGFFMLPVLRNRDRRNFTSVAFSNQRNSDDMTAAIRAQFDEWHEVVKLDDGTLAEKIRDERIDILVDLSGHTQGNRLRVFALKPAPVQAVWMGYVGTTGLAAMDWLITDRRENPPGSESEAVERLMLLPDHYICYEPPIYAPDVGPLPMIRNGWVTFGCFNNLAKLNAKVIALWARLLTELPTARLLIKTNAVGAEAERVLRAEFTNFGGDSDRLMVSGGAPHLEFLNWYNRVDVALDPFPYSGGLTTLEALWMGVPVVTRSGDRFCSRHTSSHVSVVGFPEWVAKDDADYLRIAREMSADPVRLALLRGGLRDRVRRSPICDGARVAGNLEAAFRMMWRAWCADRSPPVNP